MARHKGFIPLEFTHHDEAELDKRATATIR